MKQGIQALIGLLKWGVLFVCELAVSAYAQEATVPAALNPAAFGNLRIGLDTMGILVIAMLVFWMNAGFARVESGLCRARKCANILSENFIVFALSTVSLIKLEGLDIGEYGNEAYPDFTPAQ